MDDGSFSYRDEIPAVVLCTDNFDQDYQAVLSMQDKGESEAKGSLIVRKEGKGRFIYTGLVFFRQLPAGVPGAFKLFANIISNPNNKVNE
jgi:hypothetical protein